MASSIEASRQIVPQEQRGRVDDRGDQAHTLGARHRQRRRFLSTDPHESRLVGSFIEHGACAVGVGEHRGEEEQRETSVGARGECRTAVGGEIGGKGEERDGEGLCWIH